MNNDSYTGVQKAAILLITLGPEKAATIFKHLKEDEIEELTLEIANTRSVSPQTCLLYTSPSPRDTERSRMPSSA